MSFLLAGAIAVGAAGAAKAISGGVQKKKAKAAQAQAQADLDAQKQAFKNLDTSNPYANLENTMEDLTVNQEEASKHTTRFKRRSWIVGYSWTGSNIS